MVVRLNQVKSFHQGLNIMYLETFDIFQFSLCCFFFYRFNSFYISQLRATRRQLSAIDLPSGGSEGFNQCTEDLVETRGESSQSHLNSPDGYCYTVGDITAVCSYLLDVCQWSTTDFFLFSLCSAVVFKVTEPTSEVPDHIRPNHLIKELTKEIRYLEVRGKEEGRIYDIWSYFCQPWEELRFWIDALVLVLMIINCPENK